MLRLFRPIFFVCGVLALIMTGLLLAPMIYGYLVGDPEYLAFLKSAIISLLFGALLIFWGRERRFRLTSRQLYLLTSMSWLQLSFVGALPLMLTGHPLTLSEAVFEAVSGITTTGSTVISGINTLPPSILLWRSLLQWVGGLGVIGMAVTILPFLRVGGMRLFQTESSDWSEKSLPRFHEMAHRLLFIYLMITLACGLCYWVAGMTPFDAVNHAMTTVSTGGYATDDASMGRFNDTILWIAVVFMMIGGMPFMLYIRFLSQRNWSVFADQQAKGFIAIVAFLIAILTLEQVVLDGEPLMRTLTQAAFNIVSIITTTGYASADYTLWGEFSIGLFFIATFIGGCSGSTSGGMKVFRFQLSYQFLADQMHKLVHPRSITSIRYNGKPIPDDIVASAVAFSFLFFIVLAATTLILTALGVEFITAFTGAITALTNVGPGLGDTIGPAGNFHTLPDTAKWLLSLAMILGRLELLTVMVLLSPVFWRG
ncbi:TrkH family potassium uptake protein [Marinobacterium mangrovicola]|uniref:Trk system potassium uptake protein n=1 Tax=Marinobacterium mangrovicola TaxID=1476959 RepID=A0A4R1H8P0_9GAMM|nr:TrkH family potassium uptake protein [Marinobacterium mangrovicola]TCK16540.1 trk system potassium uptake protein TrkH [Marinobacterium mangrovicola]